jgi:hypothetical protein
MNVGGLGSSAMKFGDVRVVGSRGYVCSKSFAVVFRFSVAWMKSRGVRERGTGIVPEFCHAPPEELFYSLAVNSRSVG